MLGSTQVMVSRPTESFQYFMRFSIKSTYRCAVGCLSWRVMRAMSDRGFLFFRLDVWITHLRYVIFLCVLLLVFVDQMECNISYPGYISLVRVDDRMETLLNFQFPSFIVVMFDVCIFCATQCNLSLFFFCQGPSCYHACISFHLKHCKIGLWLACRASIPWLHPAVFVIILSEDCEL